VLVSWLGERRKALFAGSGNEVGTDGPPSPESLGLANLLGVLIACTREEAGDAASQPFATTGGPRTPFLGPRLSDRSPEAVTCRIKRVTTREGDSTEEVLMAPVSDIAYLREIAEHHGVEVVETKSTGVEPVSTIAVVLVGTVLAVSTVSRLLEERKGGQVIDMRPGANLAVFRSRDVQYGLIVVLAADGTVTVRGKDSQDKLSLLVECLSGLATQKIEAKTNAIVEAAREQLGTDVEIMTGPSTARD
jgi:hypothetical protein